MITIMTQVKAAVCAASNFLHHCTPQDVRLRAFDKTVRMQIKRKNIVKGARSVYSTFAIVCVWTQSLNSGYVIKCLLSQKF